MKSRIVGNVGRVLILGALSFAGAGCQGPAKTDATSDIAAQPGLSLGERAPDATLTTESGSTVRLASLYANGPVVVVFYRGGWCPYCHRALAAWRGKVGELAAAGGTLVAITPEKPEKMMATRSKNGVEFTVLSDVDHAAAKAFRVHFTVDDATRTKYEGYGIDLGESNASGTWELPAPGTFVIDREGVVRYAFADWDYTKRADPDEVIDAVKRVGR